MGIHHSDETTYSVEFVHKFRSNFDCLTHPEYIIWVFWEILLRNPITLGSISHLGVELVLLKFRFLY